MGVCGSPVVVLTALHNSNSTSWKQGSAQKIAHPDTDTMSDGFRLFFIFQGYRGYRASSRICGAFRDKVGDSKLNDPTARTYFSGSCDRLTLTRYRGTDVFLCVIMRGGTIRVFFLTLATALTWMEYLWRSIRGRPLLSVRWALAR